MTSEQQQPVNNGHCIVVPRVVVVPNFDCTHYVGLVSATDKSFLINIDSYAKQI